MIRKFGLAAMIISAVVSQSFGQVASGPAVWSGLFGNRDLSVETPNNPGNDYTMVLHQNDPDYYLDELAYSEERGWGFEIINEDGEADRNGSGIFGPFDDSPNGRNNFPDDELYNSFIGFKSHPTGCDALLFDPEDRNAPCSDEIEPSGGIFRIDVPNGSYSFVGVFGDSQHNHAHRILVENGGSGLPEDIGEDHVVLIGNHNGPDYVQYVLSEEFPGSDLTVGRDQDEGGNLAVVGFGDSLPPASEADFESQPLFVYYDSDGNPLLDENGAPLNLENGTPSAPVLEVTEGYVRVHLLQGNSNDTFAYNPLLDEEDYLFPRDANGADMILFEVIPVGSSGTPGDFDGSGERDVADLDLLAAAMVTGDLDFDLTGDGNVDLADRVFWVEELSNTFIGDANFDGEFNSADFVTVFVPAKYETGEAATWSEGDWNGDGVFNSGDFVAAFTGGGYEGGPREGGLQVVPEPSSMALFVFGFLTLVVGRKR